MAKILKSMTPEQKAAAKRLANELQSFIPWRETPQGQRYWEEVYTNLRGLARYDVYPFNEDLGLPGKLKDGMENVPDVEPDEDNLFDYNEPEEDGI